MGARQLETRLGSWIERATRWMAYGGGLVLLLVAGVTVVSILGRGLGPFGLGPVPGDYELLANGCALAVFSFLPYCQITRGHVTVDVLSSQLPRPAQNVLALLGDALMALAALILLRQFWFGFAEKYPFGSDAFREALGMGYKPFFAETTYELEIPIWALYGIAWLGALMFAVTALFCVWRSLNDLLHGEVPA